MTLVELKKSIHTKVDELEDANFLELVNTMMDNKGKVFEIPEGHLADIKLQRAALACEDGLKIGTRVY